MTKVTWKECATENNEGMCENLVHVFRTSQINCSVLSDKYFDCIRMNNSVQRLHSPSESIIPRLPYFFITNKFRMRSRTICSVFPAKFGLCFPHIEFATLPICLATSSIDSCVSNICVKSYSGTPIARPIGKPYKNLWKMITNG